MFWGRRAAALWLLAALLHGPALADRLGLGAAPAASQIVATMAQVAADAIVIGGLVLLAGLLRGAQRRPVSVLARRPEVSIFRGVRSFDSHSLFAPRPPPVA